MKRLVPSPSAPAELLRALSAALASLHIRWYLFGAQAVTIWGRPRLTTDVDVTIQLHLPPAELVTRLNASGFQLTEAFSDEFVRTTRVLPLLHVPSGMPLDIVLAGPGLEEQFIDRAVAVDVDDLVVPVVSPEDLIVTKVLAGRPKDVEDLRGVLHVRADTIDLDYIRRTLAMLEDAMGQSDLTPLFEAEVARGQRGSVG